MTKLYSKEQIEEWASKRADDAGRLSRQLLDTMLRVEELEKGLDIAIELNNQHVSENERLREAIRDMSIAHNMSHEPFCNTSDWKDQFEKIETEALASCKHSVVEKE